MSGNPNEWDVFRDRVQPTSVEWDEFCKAVPVGSITSGTVLSHHPFGFFLDLGWGTTCVGLIEVLNILDVGEYIHRNDFPPIGALISRAIVLDHMPHNKQARLTMRPDDLADYDRGTQYPRRALH